MKNSVKELLEEAQLRTSPDFTQRTMDRLEAKLRRRLRLQLFVFIAGVALFALAFVFTFIFYGLEFKVFGLSADLPEVPLLSGVTLLSALIILYLYQSIQSIDKVSQ